MKVPDFARRVRMMRKYKAEHGEPCPDCGKKWHPKTPCFFWPPRTKEPDQPEVSYTLNQKSMDGDDS